MFKKINDAEKRNEKDYTVFNYLREAKNIASAKCPATTNDAFSKLDQVDETLKVCTTATVG